MSVDRYTKAMLTIIAACLVWMSLGGPSLITTVEAQNSVVIGGWSDIRGTVWKFPVPSSNAASTVTPFPLPTGQR